MKIIALGCQHGNLIDVNISGELTIITGDIFPTCDHSTEFQFNWFEGNFLPWLNGLDTKYKILISGNHDFVMEKDPLACVEALDAYPRIFWLNDNFLDYKGLFIYGTPWTFVSDRWVFQADKQRQKEIFDLIPEGTNLLVSHGPPYDILDLVKYPHPGEDPHVGSKPLLDAIKRVVPKNVVFSHIHEAYGSKTFLLPQREEMIHFYNVSILDEEYKLVNKPTVIEV